ncbi:MAG: M23 family metallopeptidase [Rhodovibrionaceae bacterium]|nr:M23 family metallopeptidase [Rhodovibrionaceae bacterium]
MKQDSQRPGLGARRLRALAAFALIAVALTACGRSSDPAPVSYGQTRASAVDRPALYTVRKGDTAYGISRRFNVDLRALIDANNLRPPYTLSVGQRLRLPAPPVHVVSRGDTVYGISRRYGVDMRELVRLNNLRRPYTIVVGQRILLPGRGAATEGTRVATASSGSGRSPTTAGPPTPPRKPAQTAAAKPARPAAIPNPQPRSSGRFLWPVKGRVVSRFGPKAGGLHNDGINIAAPRGTPILAAENGVVAYVGNELRGFGNLVLIKHSDNYVTAYAHADEILVSRGQQIKRGQTIARVGTSGSVSEPQLHFEVRRGTRAVNPAGVLGSATATSLTPESSHTAGLTPSVPPAVAGPAAG